MFQKLLLNFQFFRYFCAREIISSASIYKVLEGDLQSIELPELRRCSQNIQKKRTDGRFDLVMKYIQAMTLNTHFILIENLANVIARIVFSTQMSVSIKIENDSTVGPLLNTISSLNLFDMKFL